MNNLASIIGKNVAALRKARGLTQQELAEEIHYSDKSISKWELGYAAPSVDILIDIARFFGVTVDYLLTEQNEESINEVTVNEEAQKEKKRQETNKALILSMTMTFVVLVAFSIYFSDYIFQGSEHWIRNLIVFLWMVPAGAFLAAFEVWKFFHNRVAVIVLLSLFVWSLLISFCVQFGFVNEKPEQIWFILSVGAPIQIILILIANYKLRK